MRTKLLCSVGLALGLVGASTAVTNITIYADGADGILEVRDSLPPENPWPTIQDTSGWEMNVGEWYGPGLTTPVIPFQLPDFGPVADPFISADLGVMVHTIGADTSTDIDLYAVRTSTDAAILASDWYNGSAFDPGATLIQESFLSPSSSAGFVGAPNNFTDATGSSNLLSYLNSTYDNGAGAGTFVFLRLSYGSDTFAGGWDAYKLTSRNAGQVGEWPVMTVTIDPDADTDMDGMPDLWEGANGLDPYDDGSINIDNGAIGNPDDDGLVNSNEYALGTHATIADTDDDGLLDGDEVNATLTDPLIWDTDGDKLNDGYEVTNSLTNPLLTDTDLDEEDDWLELFQGTDPLIFESSSAALGLLVVDADLDTGYGDAVAVQTVNTAWEDNLDELNASYAYVQNGRLFLMITGNMNTNWHGLEIFIDSTDAVTTNLLETAGNDNTANMDGLIFDTGFAPDYHLLCRLGDSYNGYNFNVDFADLATKAVSYHLNGFDGMDGGVAYMGPGDANSEIIAFAFTNSNIAGVISGTDAANQAAARAVTTGFECSIALSDLGDPYGEIRIVVMVTSDDHATISNQILGGLQPMQNALGTANNVNLNSFSGEQFFGFIGQLVPSPAIISMQMVSTNTEIQLELKGLIVGENYMVQDTADLVSKDFSDVAGSEFTAASTNDIVTVPAGNNSALFLRVVAP